MQDCPHCAVLTHAAETQATFDIIRLATYFIQDTLCLLKPNIAKYVIVCQDNINCSAALLYLTLCDPVSPFM